MTFDRKKLLPFILSALVIIADQVTKALIVKMIPYGHIGVNLFDELIRIVHVSNLGVAFSFGYNWPLVLRRIAFGIVPLVVIGLVVYVYLRNNSFNQLQRWAIAGIIGGGIGNIIDRFFRAEGVVDFIDVKFFGIFGLNRWPTFNVADSAVVVCGIILLVSFIVSTVQESKQKKQQDESKGE